jgi:hypothetical protein
LQNDRAELLQQIQQQTQRLVHHQEQQQQQQQHSAVSSQTSNSGSVVHADSASKAGFLEKKGHINKTWKRRYVVWNPSQKSMRYFTDASRAEEKGTCIFVRTDAFPT